MPVGTTGAAPLMTPGLLGGAETLASFCGVDDGADVGALGAGAVVLATCGSVLRRSRGAGLAGFGGVVEAVVVSASAGGGAVSWLDANRLPKKPVWVGAVVSGGGGEADATWLGLLELPLPNSPPKK